MRVKRQGNNSDFIFVEKIKISFKIIGGSYCFNLPGKYFLVMGVNSRPHPTSLFARHPSPSAKPDREGPDMLNFILVYRF